MDSIFDPSRNPAGPCSSRPGRSGQPLQRAFLRRLGGGCDLPCGALAEARPDGVVAIEVLLATVDGKTVLRARHAGAEPEAVGAEAARILLHEQGGCQLLPS